MVFFPCQNEWCFNVWFLSRACIFFLPLLTLDVYLIYGYVFSLGLHSFLYTDSFVVFFISSDTLARRLLSKRGSNNQTIMITSCHYTLWFYVWVSLNLLMHFLCLRQCITMIIPCHIPSNLFFCLGSQSESAYALPLFTSNAASASLVAASASLVRYTMACFTVWYFLHSMFNLF